MSGTGLKIPTSDSADSKTPLGVHEDHMGPMEGQGKIQYTVNSAMQDHLHTRPDNGSWLCYI